MASNAKAKDVKFHLKNARLSFPALFVPDEMKNDDGKVTKKYGANFLIPKDSPQVKELQRAMQQVAIEKFGEAGKAIFVELWKQGRTCMRDGNTKRHDSGEIFDGYEGHYLISAHSLVRPTVIDRDRSPLQEGDGKPYSGCYVNAIIAVWAQTGQYGKRINAQLQGVQFVKDGDAFGGGRAASAEEFDAIGDEFADASSEVDADLDLS